MLLLKPTSILAYIYYPYPVAPFNLGGAWPKDIGESSEVVIFLFNYPFRGANVKGVAPRLFYPSLLASPNTDPLSY